MNSRFQIREVETCFDEFLFIFSRMFLTITLFIARGIIAGVFQAAYVYTPEVKSSVHFLSSSFLPELYLIQLSIIHVDDR